MCIFLNEHYFVIRDFLDLLFAIKSSIIIFDIFSKVLHHFVGALLNYRKHALHLWSGKSRSERMPEINAPMNKTERFTKLKINSVFRKSSDFRFFLDIMPI